jgi:hypothetical protein
MFVLFVDRDTGSLKQMAVTECSLCLWHIIYFRGASHERADDSQTEIAMEQVRSHAKMIHGQVARVVSGFRP